ncbi:hypothetical protein G7Y89_g9606 [Cudoniella acicularis]|uniref:Ankyrin repeat protein n=1 Tax=Cudoniella acicularis TaxID=354080 RepID=A0A8H4W1Q6_9HELO|nr:hypothetical protein G7Y89_g9606 [Cudoniella acicularis]
MCDPITIIGLAGTVIQIVETSGRLISKSCEIYASVDGVFRENAELETLVTDLQKTNAKLARIPLQLSTGDVIDRDDKALRQLCCGCNEVADELLDRLALLKVGSGGDSRKLDSVKYAWRFMRNEKELNALAARVAAYREQLHSRILVSLTERFDGLQLEQACRFDNLDRTGRDILDNIKHNRTHITTEIGNQTSYLTRLANSHHEEIIDKLSIIVQTRSASPNPFGSDEEGASHLSAGQTIHDMIEIGNHTAMHLALRRKPDAIYEMNSAGETPLHVAVRKGDIKATEYLIRKGANKNADDSYDQTPLHLAVKGNHVDLIRLLLSKGADPQLQDEAGNTPVDIADPDSEAAWIFNIGPGLEDHDHRGYTILRHFVNLGKQDIVNNLLDRGADINAPWEDEVGMPLMTAGLNLDLAMMQLLLDRGADIEAPANRGGSALVCLTWNRKRAAVEFLLDHGANIESYNNVGFHALHEAAFHGYEDVLVLLLDRGADMEARTGTGTSALGLAVWGGSQVVQILLDRGAQINAVNGDNATPLHDSSQEGFDDITKILLERGAQTEKKRREGYTPLCLASRDGHLESMRLLLELGHAHLDAKNYQGWTPLIEAAHRGNFDGVKLLVEAGACVTTTHDGGRTALAEAINQGNDKIADYLRKKMSVISSPEGTKKPN